MATDIETARNDLGAALIRTVLATIAGYIAGEVIGRWISKRLFGI